MSAPATSRLTGRQVRIVMAAAKGTPDKAIGEKVGASHSAVREAWKKIFRKLGVHTRTEAAMLVALDPPRCPPDTQMRNPQTRNCRPQKPCANVKP